MQVDLTNFKSHISRSFTFPEKGVVLVSGCNGSGKTAILRSIVYALYGEFPAKSAGARKPYTHKKTTCSVTLHFANMVIVRNARPKSLTVTFKCKEYYDADAQILIEKNLGMDYDEFVLSSYIVQRKDTSILSMSSQDKLAFVEKLSNAKSTEAKEKIKAAIKDTISTVTRLETKTEMEQTALDGVSLLDPPPKPKYVSAVIESQIQELESQVDKHTGRITELRKKLEVNAFIIVNLKTLRDTQTKLESEIQIHTDSLEENPSDEQMAEAETYLAAVTKNKRYADAYADYIKLKKSFDLSIKEHHVQRKKRLKELVPPEPEIIEQTQEEYSSAVAEYNSYSVTIEKNSQVEKVRKKLKGDVALYLRKVRGVVVECPSTLVEALEFLHSIYESSIKAECPERACPLCNGSIAYRHDTDEIFPFETMSSGEYNTTQIKTFIDRLAEYKQTLDNTLAEPVPVLEHEDPSVIFERLQSLIKVRDEYESLTNEEVPASLMGMKQRVADLERRYDKPPEGDVDVTSAKDALETLKRHRDSYLAKSETINALSAKLVQIKKKIKTLEVSSIDESTTIKEISNLGERVSALTAKTKTLRAELSAALAYEDYISKTKRIDEMKKSLTKSQLELKKSRALLDGLYILQDSAKEAEVVAFDETLKAINFYAKQYIDELVDTPISITLECVKTAKLSVVTRIEYKGDDYEDIEEFSGGERQKCELAFILGINDMLRSKILLLDECLNNIDENTNGEILMQLKKLTAEKLVLLVSHESVKGIFDYECPV